MGREKRKVWLWLAIERGSRRIVAWVVGERDAATTRRQWQAPPRRHCWYFTDLWDAYIGVLSPRWQHLRCSKGSGSTSIVEVVNYSLCQRYGLPVRKSCLFSKKWKCMPQELKSLFTIRTLH